MQQSVFLVGWTAAQRGDLQGVKAWLSSLTKHGQTPATAAQQVSIASVAAANDHADVLHTLVQANLQHVSMHYLLNTAIASGSTHAVRALVSLNAQVDGDVRVLNSARVDILWPLRPVGVAIQHNQVPALKYLLSRNATLREDESISAFQFAVYKHSSNKVLRVLVAAKTDLEKECRAQRGSTLRVAAARGVTFAARVLLRHDVARKSVNATHWDGHTPLFLAAFWGHDVLVRMLLEYGADVNRRVCFGQNAGMSALDAATTNRHDRVARLLEKHLEKED